MFELDTSVKARLLDLEVLSQKNRPPESNPGVVLSFSAELPNSALSMLDGFLLAALYTKNASSSKAKQAALDGVEPVSDMPNLSGIGQKIGRFSWDLEQTGCELTFDYGTGGKSNLLLSDVKVEGLHITPKEGGSCVWQWKCEIGDVAESDFGKLATFKNRDVYLLLAGPQVAQENLEEQDEPPKRRGRK